MEALLSAYGDDQDKANAPLGASLLTRELNVAPAVEALSEPGVRQFENPLQRQLTYNARAEAVYAPVYGPTDPNAHNPQFDRKNTLTGLVEPAHVDDWSFRDQFHTFNARGYALDPAGPASVAGASSLVGSADAVAKYNGASVYENSKKATEAAAGERPRRKRQGQVDAPDYLGPWAPYENNKELPVYKPRGYIEAAVAREAAARAAAAAAAGGSAVAVLAPVGSDTAEPMVDDKAKMPAAVPVRVGVAAGPTAPSAAASDAAGADEKAAVEPAAAAAAATVPGQSVLAVGAASAGASKRQRRRAGIEEDIFGDLPTGQVVTAGGEHSVLHIRAERDYQGRSWLQPPSDLKPTDHECWMPKKLIHTWAGHTKGVSRIELFPKYGHLLLSGGLDGQLMLWDVNGTWNRALVRSYQGHAKPVKDINFSLDGRKFISASFDRTIKLWDTETGQCISAHSNGKVPCCARLQPEPSKQHEVLAGCSDKKIVQWDLNANRVVQEYDQHLGAVNTVTFVDDNRRFVSSSDDKTLRVYEYGIPVVIKYIAEPHMHSMPVIVKSPDLEWLLCQSLDNQIVVYSTKDRFKFNRKKNFRGHVNAGFPCGLAMSPDGQYVVSGDGTGNMWIWAWKNNRKLKTMKCHEQVITGILWHPIEKSRVITCSWDGKINYWD